MQVPLLDPQVSIQSPGVPTPQLADITPSASGVGIAEAASRLGQTIEQVSDKLAQHIIYKERLEAQQEVYDRASVAQAKLQDKAYAKDGWMNRLGNQAKGITSGNLPQGFVGPTNKNDIKFDDSFEGYSLQLKKESMAGLNPLQQKMLTRLLDSHISSMRGSVIKHESQQTQQAYEASIANQLNALKQSGAEAATFGDLQYVIAEGQRIRRDYYGSRGADDEDSLKASDQATANDFVSAAVKANLDRDPETAKELLEGTSNIISPTIKAELQDNVDGKMLKVRREAAWDHVKNLRNLDGTANIMAMEKEAEKLADSQTLPPGQKEHIIQFVKQQATLLDGALRDFRQSQNRAFYNEGAKMRNQGIPYERAFDKLKNYAYDAKDLDEKTKMLQSLYLNDKSFYNKALEHQTDEQKMAWAEIQHMAKAKFGKTTVKLEGEDFQRLQEQVFLDEMKKQVLGSSPEMMKKKAIDSLKDIIVKPGFLWDTKEPAFRVSAEIRSSADLQIAGIEKLYGANLVTQAKQKFAAKGIQNPTPKELRDFLEQAKQ